jgi:16S rRNA (guanine527-N7)-methyltransferase
VHPLWDELAWRAGLQLSHRQHQSLCRYLDLLLQANKTMNLTRIADRAQADLQHVGDALTLLPFLPREPHRLVDVGSGGGVPGIVLGIVREDARVTLVEATKKKARFLSQTAQTLDLKNLSVIAWRAEDLGRGALRESFDVAVARAVAPLALLAQWCLPLVKVGGKLLAMKGPKVHQELHAAQRAITVLGGANPIIHDARLPQTPGHLIVEIPKLTPATDRN